MATIAQIEANKANAIHSTGPKSAEGKRRSSQNAVSHGFAAIPSAGPELAALEASLREAIRPSGAFEEDILLQIRDAAWRLRQIRAEIHRHYAGTEPYNDPEHARRVHALTRYRAAAEMQFFKALEILRELQTTRLYRAIHLADAEKPLFPISVQPRLFRTILVDGIPMNRADREHLFFSQNEPNSPPDPGLLPDLQSHRIPSSR